MRGQDTQLPGPGHRVLLCCCTGCSPHGHSGPRAGPRLKRLLAGGHTALSVVGGKQPHKESPLERGEGSEKGQAVGIGGHHLPRTAGGWDEPAGWGPGVLGISLECPQGAAAGRGRGRCWGVASPLAPLPACWWPRLGGLGSPRWGREWAPSEAGRPCPSPGPPLRAGAPDSWSPAAVHTALCSPGTGVGGVEGLRGGLGAGGGAARAGGRPRPHEPFADSAQLCGASPGEPRPIWYHPLTETPWLLFAQGEGPVPERERGGVRRNIQRQTQRQG